MLQDADIVLRLLWACKARKNGAIRIYNLFLLIGSALKFLAQRAGTSPQEAPSWSIVSKTQKDYQKLVKREHNAAMVCPPNFPLLGEGDYSNLRDKCIILLEKAQTWPQKEQRRRAREYMDNLILMTLISVATPRHQVFSLMEQRHLQWIDEEATYQIVFDGSNPPLKNGKAINLLLPSSLSTYYLVTSPFCSLDSPIVGLVADFSPFVLEG